MSATMSDDAIVIVNGARTPMGGFQGALKDVSATELGAAAIKAAVARAGVAIDDIDEVIMGCILTAGLGQGPARQAMRGPRANTRRPAHASTARSYRCSATSRPSTPRGRAAPDCR